MKVVLEVKNTSKIIKPTENDVILYDGKQWFVTTKQILFKDWNKLLNQCEKKLADLEKQNSDFKREVGLQLKEMTELIQKLFEAKGEDL
jgi:hypothetical protein